MPTEIDQLERRATQLEIEKQALKKKKTRIRRNASLMSKKSSPESASNRTLSKPSGSRKKT